MTIVCAVCCSLFEYHRKRKYCGSYCKRRAYLLKKNPNAKQYKIRRHCRDCNTELTALDKRSRCNDCYKKWISGVHQPKIELIRKSCSICGYNKCQRALHYHHVKPDEKLFEVSQAQRLNKSPAEIQTEMKKCIIVCANCHAEIHDGLVDISAQ